MKFIFHAVTKNPSSGTCGCLAQYDSGKSIFMVGMPTRQTQG
ncbi:hypothetical protein J2Y61_004292 [Asticcacaulis sp. BE141]|nr:hypothetical protein [Asticcacaulis sp. BE141]